MPGIFSRRSSSWPRDASTPRPGTGAAAAVVAVAEPNCVDQESWAVQPSQQELAVGVRLHVAGMCGGEGERERLRVGVWGAGATPDRDDPGVERCSALPPIAADVGDSMARIAAAASAAETGAAGTGPAVRYYSTYQDGVQL